MVRQTSKATESDSVLNKMPTEIFSNVENQLIDECFAFAKALVKDAGELVKEGYSKSNDDLGIVEKQAKWDMVTDYDKKTEAFLIDTISAKYPDHT